MVKRICTGSIQATIPFLAPATVIATTLAVVVIVAGCGGDGTGISYSRNAESLHQGPESDQLLEPINREAYDSIVENEFLDTLQNPMSTFSIDVDTASYANVRRIVNEGRLPPRGAVRLEEFINYFDYDYPHPTDEHPFSVNLDLAQCPWNERHQLLRVALKGREIETANRPASNIVFLLDVSGSMKAQNKLPLVQSSMRLLVDQLKSDDRIAIVVYAGASGVVLPSTSVNEKQKILDAIDRLQAGGSTNGAAGIELAYQIASGNMLKNGTNRVVLCTDGDFNVGTTSQSNLVDLITEKAKSNVFLSVFGFGTGNYQDSTMEKLADKGNGNYGYIDSMLESHKTFVRELGANLITIAKDVKIQIDFNPAHVAAYRLLGYENRRLANEDFKDDSKDAGEIGAGHTVTAFYEIVPAGVESQARTTTESEFVTSVIKDGNEDTALVMALRYKQPDSNISNEFKIQFNNPVVQHFSETAADFQFAAAVVVYGMLLRDSKFLGTADLDWVVSTAKSNCGADEDGYRADFVQIAKKSRLLLDGGASHRTTTSYDGNTR